MCRAGSCRAGVVPGGEVNKNIILNSGNGIGNTIISKNLSIPPFAPSPFLPPGIPGLGGINVNVIAGSGNGAGNVISAGNAPALPGQININVIAGSGNGAGNIIRLGNR
jgi:hypothetical protein